MIPAPRDIWKEYEMTLSRDQMRVVSMVASVSTVLTLYYTGAGWWAFIVYPFGLFEFYEGLTAEDRM